MDFLYKLFLPVQMALKTSVESFIRLETADDSRTIVAKDGSLLTYLRIDGSRQIIGEEEYSRIIEGATIKIGSRFDKRGHALQVFFVRDPARVKRKIEAFIHPSRVSARNIGLEVEDLFDERARHLAKFLAHEECYFVLWTRPSAMTKNELQRAAKEAKEKNGLAPAIHNIRWRRLMRCALVTKATSHLCLQHWKSLILRRRFSRYTML